MISTSKKIKKNLAELEGGDFCSKLSRTLLSWILEDAVISFSAALCPLLSQCIHVFNPTGAGLLKGHLSGVIRQRE